MPSPFPGMNPYLERAGVWNDFHETVIPVLRELLTPQLAPKYFGQINETLYIELDDGPDKLLGRPDIGIVTPRQQPDFSRNVATLEPVAVVLPSFEPLGQSFVEIRDQHHNRVVTVIEVLSPANKKPGRNRKQYLKKRRRYLSSGANLVEIDLLRAYPRMPMKGLPECDYCVLVSRVSTRPRGGVWAVGLRDPLPTINIPLLANDPEVTINLKHAVDLVYDRAGYNDHIYNGLPQPPLNDDDAVWAAQFIPKTARGK